MKYKTKLCLAAALGMAASIACLFLGRTGSGAVQYMARPAGGDGDREQTLVAEIAGEKQSVSVVLKEIPLTEEEILEKLADAKNGLERLFLNGNADMGHITGDVQMPSSWPGSRISIQWYLDSWDCIEPDGKVHGEGLEKAAPVQVRAVLSLEGQTALWEGKVLVCPPKRLNAGQKVQVLKKQIQDAQEGTDGRFRLPDSVGGEAVVWYREPDKSWLWILLLTLAAIAAMAAGRQRDEEALQRQRERSLQLDYPDIVSSLSLYMGAGLAARKAWERIIEEQAGKKGREKVCRAAYDEMHTTLREMQSGVSEALAYERFGMRCRLPSYLKLGALLSQNLRKGTKNLAVLLQEEARDAFEDRKALAKTMGEECESKLLMPMLLMLLTVLVLIMYPAAMSFQM